MRSFRSSLLAAIALASLSAGLGAKSATQASVAAPATLGAPDVGQPASDFTASWADVAGTGSVSLSALRGKVVALNEESDAALAAAVAKAR